MKDKDILELEELVCIFIQKREDINQCLGDLESAYGRIPHESISNAMNHVRKQYTLADTTLKHISKYHEMLTAFEHDLREKQNADRPKDSYL